MAHAVYCLTVPVGKLANINLTLLSGVLLTSKINHEHEKSIN